MDGGSGRRKAGNGFSRVAACLCHAQAYDFLPQPVAWFPSFLFLPPSSLSPPALLLKCVRNGMEGGILPASP